MQKERLIGAEPLEDILRITAQNQGLAIQAQSKQHVNTCEQARSQDNAHLTSLTMKLVHWPSIVELLKSKHFVQSCGIALQHLLFLELTIYFGKMPMDDDARLPQEHVENGEALHTFLQSAPKLTSLRLNFAPYYTPYSQDCGALHVLCHELGETELLVKHAIGGPFTWSHLRHLRLGSMKVDSEELVQILTRHAGTLKSLYLERVLLLTGSWRHALNQIMDVLTLEKLTLKGTFAAELEGVYQRCYMTIHIVKKGEFVVSWPKFVKWRLGHLKVRMTLGDNQLGRILFEEEGDAADAPAQCMKWWTTSGKNLGIATGGDARIPALYIP